MENPCVRVTAVMLTSSDVSLGKYFLFGGTAMLFTKTFQQCRNGLSFAHEFGVLSVMVCVRQSNTIPKGVRKSSPTIGVVISATTNVKLNDRLKDRPHERAKLVEQRSEFTSRARCSVHTRAEQRAQLAGVSA